MKRLCPDSIVVRDSGIVSADIDGMVVLLSVEDGKYYGALDTAAFFWERMANPISIAELCRNASTTYRVDAEACQDEVVSFVEQLLTAGIAQVVDKV
ncbi:PqqD family protein [Methylomonas methanica]|uniref:Coenzyme PQQ synthesis protein D (PqqD) n=1 Tax=Methylomonas methanica (strain DSM 25384 / MC09) TaxID=857087 RepID=F9ZW47_METMM|nr:PqqD family protein [Methylomonas methanica]AEG02018.1 hypothetical protein Metme_3657 [Methylomonas methanica MC09]